MCFHVGTFRSHFRTHKTATKKTIFPAAQKEKRKWSQNMMLSGSSGLRLSLKGQWRYLKTVFLAFLGFHPCVSWERFLVRDVWASSKMGSHLFASPGKTTSQVPVKFPIFGVIFGFLKAVLIVHRGEILFSALSLHPLRIIPPSFNLLPRLVPF